MQYIIKKSLKKFHFPENDYLCTDEIVVNVPHCMVKRDVPRGPSPIVIKNPVRKSQI